jgi:3-hydroxymyristoyl/3-hydroxydecanoyl-(acyl carrier protein) dehydratase
MSIVRPEIVTESAGPNRVELQLRVPADLIYLQGHFPDEPVLPGVVQVDWAIELAGERFDLKPDFKAIEGLKFHRIIKPETVLTLLIEYDAEVGRLRFCYSSGGDIYSQGRVLFS